MYRAPKLSPDPTKKPISAMVNPMGPSTAQFRLGISMTITDKSASETKGETRGSGCRVSSAIFRPQLWPRCFAASLIHGENSAAMSYPSRPILSSSEAKQGFSLN